MTLFALVTAPLALAAILAFAGVAKVIPQLRGGASHEVLTAPGLPRFINAPWARRLHPWAEILVGLALVSPWPFSLMGAVAALGLCCFYSWLMWRLVRAEEPQDCACFGAFSRRPASRRDVARNLGLVALALLSVLWAGAGRSVPADLWTMPAENWWWLGAVAVAVAVPLAARVIPTDATQDAAPRPRPVVPAEPTVEPENSSTASAAPSAPAPDAPAASTSPGETLRSLLAERPAPATIEEAQPEDLTGTPLPDVAVRVGAAPDAAWSGLRHVTPGKALLLILARPNCQSCEQVLAQVPAWRDSWDGQVEVRVLVSRDAERFATGHRELSGLILDDPSRAVGRLLGVRYTPSALLIAPDGSIAAGPTTGPEYIAALAEVVTESVAASRA